MLLRKCALTLYDTTMCLLAVALFTLATPSCAFAYVDPSVMTYTVQALAGVAIALSTVIGVLWRRTRKKIYSKLSIDENRHKLVEPEISRTKYVYTIESSDTSTKFICTPEANSASDQVQSFIQAVHEPIDNRYAANTLKQRLIAASLICTFAVFTLFVVAPFEMIAANEIFLLFTLNDIALPIICPALIIDIVLIGVLMLFKGRIFRIACACVFAIGACCYVQALLMNFGMPLADGHKIDWNDFTMQSVFSAITWAALFSFIVFIGIKFSWKTNRMLPIIAAALIIIQGAGVVSLFVEKSGHDRPAVVTEEGMLELAPQNNIVIFVLDSTDNNDVIPLMQQNPGAFDDLKGFTMFQNVSPTLVPTRYGLPFLLTGELPKKDETFKYYLDERFKRSTLIKDVAKSGYTVDLYTDSLFNGVYELKEPTRNLHSLDNLVSADNAMSVVAILWRGALYRDMTWALKPHFWFYTDQLNNALASNKDTNPSTTPYKINDPKFYEKLKRERLNLDTNSYCIPSSKDGQQLNNELSPCNQTVSQNDASVTGKSRGAFKLIHLLGAHEPYLMDENAKRVDKGKESDAMRQTLGAFKIVNEYISQMKDLGVYDTSTIIITADHGVWYKDPPIGLEHSSSPILFVKPSDEYAKRASIESDQSTITINDNAMTHMAAIATMLEAANMDNSKYGQSAFNIESNDDRRYYYLTCLDNGEDSTVIEYAIDGNVLNFNNWKLTGFEWKVH